jgi:hypothetical protein
MKTVPKIVLVTVILGLVVLSVGCQSGGLSEDEVRAIVDAEVAAYMATINELTLSSLMIENQNGDLVAIFGATDEDTYLVIYDEYGNPVVALGDLLDNGVITIYNNDGETVVGLTSVGDAGTFSLYNSSEVNTIFLGSANDAGFLSIYDEAGDITFTAP